MTSILSVVKPPAEKPLGMSRESFERGVLIGIFGWAGFYGNCIGPLVWPAAFFVGLALGSEGSRYAFRDYTISYPQAVLWAALGANLGSFFVPLIFWDMVAPRYLPLLFTATATCLLAGVLVARTYHGIQRMLNKPILD